MTLGLSETVTRDVRREVARERSYRRQHINNEQNPHEYQRSGLVPGGMRSGADDARGGWTAEARAVAWEYHRYQMGAGEGAHTPGRAAAPGLFQEREYGVQGASAGAGQEAVVAGQRQTHQSAPRIRQGPRAMEYQHQTHSNPASYSIVSTRPPYDPAQYYWSSSAHGSQGVLQSPIFANRQTHPQQQNKPSASTVNHAVGYLPPPPPSLSSLTDPLAVLAYQTNWSPVTPFKAVTPIQTSQPLSITPSLQPFNSPLSRESKISDDEFHDPQCSTCRSSRSEPPYKSDMEERLKDFEDDSDDYTRVGTVNGTPTHKAVANTRSKGKGREIELN